MQTLSLREQRAHRVRPRARLDLDGHFGVRPALQGWKCLNDNARLRVQRREGQEGYIQFYLLSSLTS